jgi:TolA-binding protein
MRILSLLFVCIPLIWGCQNQDPEIANIESLEKEIEQSPTPENSQALLEAYEAYVANHPEAGKQNAEFLYKAAALQAKRNRFSSAIEKIHQVLSAYYDAPIAGDASLLLATIYDEKLNNKLGAQAVYQSYAAAFPKHPRNKVVKDSILADAPPLDEVLDSLKMKLYDEENNRYDYQMANDFIEVCQIQAYLLPEEKRVPEYLHEAGRIAGYIRSYEKALELYEWVYQKYPEHEKAASSLFMMAFTYDDRVNDDEKARALYQEFLEKYPDSNFAESAAFLLQNLGKSDEEIIESFSKEKKDVQ